MNKKLFVKINIGLSLCLTGLFGCTNNDEQIRNVNDGAYTAIADGYFGDIEVEVKFSNGVMTDAEVINHNENEAIANDAIINIPKYVVDNQSINVDVSTGATITSNGILNAISKTIEEAGGDISLWQEDKTNQHETKEEELSADVVVIGGGISGIATVLRLEELGYDTILIEKTSTLGGSLLFQTQPSQLIIDKTSGTKSQIEQDILSNSDNANSELIKLLCNNLEETVIWQNEILGLNFEDEFIETNDYQHESVKYFDLSDGDISELYIKEAEVSGSKILTETGIINLKQEINNIVGVKTKSADGTIYDINSDYIVFATGSGLNSIHTLTYGPSGNTGDAVLIVSGTGLSYYPSSYNYITYPAIDYLENGIDVYANLQKALTKGAFIMNQDYERFINEESDQVELANATKDLEASYLVMNQSAFDLFINDIGDTDEIEEYFSTYYGGTTLMDVCSKTNLDAGKLLNTVNKYNQSVTNKKDLTYNRSDKTLRNKIEANEKCYIIPLYNYCFDSSDGFEVDNNLNVKTIDGEVIDNIFAVGSAVGNVFGNKLPAGAGNAWAFVSAKYVADKIIETININ